MWQYCWAHVMYHLIRWFQREDRLLPRITLGVFSVFLFIPQIYVLALGHTSRYCSQPLLEMLIVSLVLTMVLYGFSFLFWIMDPIPWEVKVAFHLFGCVNMIVAILLAVFTSKATDCTEDTMALYWISIACTVFSIIGLVYFGLTVPFWILNRIWKDSVLDREHRDGVCYEPVKCCSCVWHV